MVSVAYADLSGDRGPFVITTKRPEPKDAPATRAKVVANAMRSSKKNFGGPRRNFY
jgi:hypothetical protein